MVYYTQRIYTARKYITATDWNALTSPPDHSFKDNMFTAAYLYTNFYGCDRQLM